MNIENLKEGQLIKNYKVLCELLEIKPTGGDSKKSQLKELECYCEYHKEGNKFIIDKIFDNKHEKIDMRKNNKRPSAEYMENIELNIVGELLTKGNLVTNNYVIGKSCLLRDIGMINWNYSFCKDRQEKLASYLDMNVQYVYDYYACVDDMLTRNINKALQNLKNEKVIGINTTTIICKNKTDVNYLHTTKYDEFNEKYDDVKTLTNTDKFFIQATEEERNFILKIENKILNEMKCKTIVDLYAKGKREFKDYYDKCYLEIRKQIKDMNFYYEAYDITFLYDELIKKLEKNDLDDWIPEDKEMNCNIINEEIRDRILINAKKRQDKKIEELKKCFGTMIDKKAYRINDNYCDNYKILNDNIIDLESKNINKKVKETKIKQELIKPMKVFKK